VTETDQDHGRVAVAVSVALGRLDQALDLTFGQVLAIRPISLLLRRRSATVRNSGSDVTSRRFVLAMIFALCPKVDWA
jgi:hypothetical protein